MIDEFVLFDLVRHVAYAEHWLRHTDAFDRAVSALGLRMDFPQGLMRGAEKIDSPYDEAIDKQSQKS